MEKQNPGRPKTTAKRQSNSKNITRQQLKGDKEKHSGMEFLGKGIYTGKKLLIFVKILLFGNF